MIGALIVGLLCGGAALGAANAGDRAAKRAMHRGTRFVREVGGKLQERIDTVAPPCARGAAPHQRVALDYYADGSPAYGCRACGEELP